MILQRPSRTITAIALCLAMLLPYCGCRPALAAETIAAAQMTSETQSEAPSEVVQTPDGWKFFKLVTTEAGFAAGKRYVFANANEAKEAKVLTFSTDGSFYRVSEASSAVFTSTSPSGNFLIVQDDSWIWETSQNTLLLSLYNSVYNKYLSANYQSQLMLRDTPSEQYGFRVTSSKNFAGPHQYGTPDGATGVKNLEVVYKDGLFRMLPRSSNANKDFFVYAYQEDTSIQSLSAYVDTTSGQCPAGSTGAALTGANIELTVVRTNGASSTQTIPVTLDMLEGLSLADRYVPGTYRYSIHWAGLTLTENYELTITANAQVPSAATTPLVLLENNFLSFQEANHLKEGIEYVFVHAPNGNVGFAPIAKEENGQMVIGVGEGPVIRIPGEADNYFIAEDTNWIWTYITRPGNSAIHDMGSMVYNGGMSMKEDYELLFWTREEGPYNDIGWRKGTNYNHIGFGTSKSPIYASLRYEDGRVHGVDRNLGTSLSNVSVIYEKVPLGDVVTYLDLNSGAIEANASGTVTTGGNVIVHKVAPDGTANLTAIPITLNMLSGLTFAQRHTPGVYECQVILDGNVLSENYSLTILGDNVENIISWDGYGSSAGGVAWPLNDLTGQVPQGSGGQIPTGCKLAVYDHKTDSEVVYQEVDVTLGMLNVTPEQLKEAGTITGLTLTYKGKVITDNFTLTVTEIVQDDYPDFPNAGSVRVDKQMDTTKYNYLETGSAQIDLSVTGIPITSKANVVIILDASSSMNQCTHGVSIDPSLTAQKKRRCRAYRHYRRHDR